MWVCASLGLRVATPWPSDWESSCPWMANPRLAAACWSATPASNQETESDPTCGTSQPRASRPRRPRQPPVAPTPGNMKETGVSDLPTHATMGLRLGWMERSRGGEQDPWLVRVETAGTRRSASGGRAERGRWCEAERHTVGGRVASVQLVRKVGFPREVHYIPRKHTIRTIGSTIDDCKELAY
jgi:hypothetical protein